MLCRACIALVLLLSSIFGVAQLPPGAAYQPLPGALVVTPSPSVAIINTPSFTLSGEPSAVGISLAGRVGAAPETSPYSLATQPRAYYSPSTQLNLPPGITLEAERATAASPQSIFVDFGPAVYVGSAPVLPNQQGPTLADIARFYRARRAAAKKSAVAR
jgi:hypothetical protein